MITYKTPSPFIGAQANRQISSLCNHSDAYDENDMSAPFCDRQLGHRWRKMLRQHISPIHEIADQFPALIPQFDPKFLEDVVSFFSDDFAAGSDLLSLLLRGPKCNIISLPSKQLAPLLISGLPSTMELTADILSASSSALYLLPQSFIDFGGLQSMLKFSKEPKFSVTISRILLAVSNRELSFKSPTDKNQCSLLRESRDSGILLEEASDQQNYLCLADLLERLLSSTDEEAILNTLEAARKICEGRVSESTGIANLVAAQFEKFTTNESISKAFNMLAAAGQAGDFKNFSVILDVIPKIFEGNNTELIDSAFNFIESIIAEYSIDYIIRLGLVDFFMKYAFEGQYSIKERAVMVLVQIMKACPHDELQRLVNGGLVSCMLTFLDSPSADLTSEIIDALHRVVAESGELSNEVLDQFIGYTGDLQEIAMKPDKIVASNAEGILNVLKSYILL